MLKTKGILGKRNIPILLQKNNLKSFLWLFSMTSRDLDYPKRNDNKLGKFNWIIKLNNTNREGNNLC